ncbi:MAG: MFS transporter [Kofleriaceae bacterium]|nr:MFS transporter [Kofleriaceae bacterium]
MIKNRTAIIALLTGLNLLNYIDRTIVAAVLRKIQMPEAQGGLGLSNTQAGFLATAFLLGYFLTSPLFGARADKGSRKALIALGVGIWSIATVATGFATSFSWMIIARIVVGVGEASYATLAPTIIDDLTPPETKGRALAIFYLAIPVGSALGYVIGGQIEAAWGWRAAFYVAGGPGLLLALLSLFIVEPTRKLREARGKIIDGLKTLAKLPLFRRATLGYCAYTAALGAFAHWGPKFIAEQYQGQVTDQQASTYFGLVTVVAGAIATILGGQWADRVQRRMPQITETTAFDSRENKLGINALLRICAIGMVWAAPLTAAAFWAPSAWAFFGFVFLAELGVFLSTSPVNAIGLRAVPPELRASAMAAMIFAIHLFGDLWSPTVLGYLNDVLVSSVAMMALPITFALSAYLWWPRAREAE